MSEGPLHDVPLNGPAAAAAAAPAQPAAAAAAAAVAQAEVKELKLASPEAKQGQGQAQATATDEDDKVPESVLHLLQLKESHFVEADAKVVFERYDKNNDGVWEAEDVRSFLLDLQQAFDCYRVVTDETLAAVTSELQLNADSSGRVQWMEFKSYSIYLQAYPLKQLNATVSRGFTHENAQTSVIVTNLNVNTYSAHLIQAFSECGIISSIGLVGTADKKSINLVPPQALVIFEKPESVYVAVKRVNDATIVGNKIVVTPYTYQDFPLVGGKEQKPSWVAKGIAKAIIVGQGIRLSLSEFNNKHHITENIKAGAQAVGSKLSEFDERHNISATAKASAKVIGSKVSQFDEQHNISASAKAGVQAIGSKVSKFDEEHKISESVKNASEKTKEAAKNVANNSVVQTGLGFFEQVKSAVVSTITEIKQETQIAIDQEKQKKELEAQARAQPQDGPAPQVVGQAVEMAPKDKLP